jgi:uncharacterized protein
VAFFGAALKSNGGIMKVTGFFVLFAVISVFPVKAQERPKITVNGESIVYVKPDQIVVTFGIETRDLEIMNSKQKNNEILKKAIVATKELGIPDKNVQTDSLSIEPRYRNGYERDEFLGYFVRNTLVVTLTETGKIEDLLTKVLQAGVNYIHGVNFETTALRKYRDQARESALKAAKEKAEAMAHVLSQSVGSPLQISESGGAYYPTWSSWGYGRGASMGQNSVQFVQSGPTEITDTIALGKIAVRANVSAVFELTAK